VTMEKGEDKVVRVMGGVVESVKDWLSRKPTGQLTINIEVHSSQGGVGDMFVEVRKRGKI